MYTHCDRVYYSHKKRALKLFIDQEPEEGFVPITKYREILGDEAVDEEISDILGFTQTDSINRNNQFIF